MSQFGQAPLAAYLPLRAGQNLADLPDKAAALSNLGTLSSSDIMLNAVPLGTIIPFWGSVAPVGYLPCVGQTINSGTFPDLVTFLGGTTSATVPDLRGEFLRGWDNGRGVDVGRTLSSWQDSQNKAHSHSQGKSRATASVGGTTNGTVMGLPTDPTTRDSGEPYQVSIEGGSEARPRNVAVLYCIKAYGALINTSTANMGNVLTELSQTAKLTQFENSLGTSGYQKFPNGLIIQWGYSGVLTGNANNAVTFPITFPTACVNASATCQYSTVVSGGHVLVINSITTSGMNILPDDISTTTNANLRSYWMALGY